MSGSLPLYWWSMSSWVVLFPESFAVTLHGNGFTKTDNISQVRCNFKLGDKDQSMLIVDRTKIKYCLQTYFFAVNIEHSILFSFILFIRLLFHVCLVTRATFVNETVLKCVCPAIPDPGRSVSLRLSILSFSTIYSFHLPYLLVKLTLKFRSTVKDMCPVMSALKHLIVALYVVSFWSTWITIWSDLVLDLISS